MQATAYKIGGLVMSTYLPCRAGRILEIGSLNVNGGLRDHAPRNADYVGIDFATGLGVDHVVTGCDDWPVDDDSFDLVMASSVFAHDPAFWQTFLAMCRKTRPGGYLYLNAPATGAIHRHRADYWRFHPDAGLALQAWARQHGIATMLVESFTAGRENDDWDDFCAVFRREPGKDDIVSNFVHEKVACTNALSWRTREVIRPQAQPEDRRLTDGIAAERDGLARDIAALTTQYQTVVAERDREAEGLARRKREMEQSGRELQTEITQYRAQINDLSRKLDELKAQASFAQSNLRQREEENHQYRQEISALKAGAEDVGRLSAKLADAEAWVFRLAGERAAQQSRIRQLEASMAVLTDKLDKLNRQLKQATERHDQTRHNDLATIARLRDEIAGFAKPAPNEPADHQRHRQRLEQELAVVLAQLKSEQHRAATAEDRVRAHEHQVSERFGETAKLTQQIIAKDEDIARLREDLAAQSQHVDALETRTRDVQANLKQRFAETARLTEMIMERDRKLGELDWLRQVFAKLSRRPSWWFLLPTKWRQQYEQRRLKNAGLFDAEAYVRHYPDIADEGIDPLLHYILHGMTEARQKYP